MKFGDVEILVSTMADGNMARKYGDIEQVENNKRKFFEKHGLDINNLVMASLLGGAEVVEVSAQDKGKYIECDALVTFSKDIILGLVVADCYPVVVFDSIKKILALVHLGRKGIDSGLVENICDYFKSKDVKMSDVQVFSGPGIKKDSHLWTGNPPHDPNKWGEFLIKDENGVYHIDTQGFLIKKFLDRGVLRKNIRTSLIDVYVDTNYFSHVRSFHTGEKEGRFMMVVRFV